MSIQANWRLAELLETDVPDAFDTALLSSSLRKVDLSGTEEEVFEALRMSLGSEANFYDRGITCDLKDNGQDCLTCSEYAGNRPDVKRSPLCRLGRDQRTIQLRVEELGQERVAPFLAMAEEMESYNELADVETDEELLALLDA